MAEERADRQRLTATRFEQLLARVLQATEKPTNTELAAELMRLAGGQAIPTYSVVRAERSKRDDMIRVAIDSGVSYRATARRFRLSPARIVQIAGAVQ